MLRLDATTKKRYDVKLFKFKKISIKQSFFINEFFLPEKFDKFCPAHSKAESFKFFSLVFWSK